ncbi:hypothetical protein QO200_16780 [Flavobacterium sp. Arc3]|uniref:hypothetical protein n=1 Tax=Flavobacterium sp. Arc3 TaxID=3046686 RepID=UPI00352E4317
MNTFNLIYNKLIEIEKNNENFSLTEKTLLITVKNSTTTIDLNKITNVRITKCRVLFFNYLLVIFILIFYFFLNTFTEIISTLPFSANAMCMIAISSSLFVKKYSHSVLINTIDLNYLKVKISTNC